MASSQVLVFVVVLCLGAFSGSAVGWFFWPFPGIETQPFPGTETQPFPGIETQPLDTCKDVNNNYTSCEDFIVGRSQYPPQECCSGLNYLNQISKNEANGSRRICQCIENVAARGGHPPYSESRINDLYYHCNLHLNFPISENMDCSTI